MEGFAGADITQQPLPRLAIDEPVDFQTRSSARSGIAVGLPTPATTSCARRSMAVSLWGWIPNTGTHPVDM
jgi:hypothetical protein